MTRPPVPIRLISSSGRDRYSRGRRPGDGAGPYGVAVTPDGARVLFSDHHAATVSVIDAATLRETLSQFIGSPRDSDAKIGLRGVRDGFAIDTTSSRAIPHRQASR